MQKVLNVSVVSYPLVFCWGCKSALLFHAITEVSFPSFCSAPFDRIAEINFNIDADDDSVSGHFGIFI